MRVQLSGGRSLWLLTLTAPGERSHSRWTPAQLFRRGAPRPSCDCHSGVELEDWNPRGGEHWNRLRTSLVRLLGHVEFYRAAEVQDGSRGGSGRGALHHHVVIATAGTPDVLAVQALAMAAGYGCVMDLRPVGDGLQEVAGYLSKTLAGYVSKSSGRARDEVPWRREVVDEETGEVRRLRTVPTYKTHTQSARWGCTVKEVREHARSQAKRRAAHLQSLLGSGVSAPGEGMRDVSTAGLEASRSAAPEAPT